MILKLSLAVLIAALPTLAYAQETVGQPDGADLKTVAADPVDESIEKRSARNAVGSDLNHTTAAKEPGEAAKAAIDYAYVRPNANKRFKIYLNNLAGPAALTYYSASAGLLTLRNSPKEWGTKSDGFARRFANVAAKHAIMATTVYGLDEALKVDSTFYRSRERGLAARLRNCLFSAVTARNRKGKRVPGIPVFAGGILSGVASSSAWYPNRYDYVHGLKGGAISVGMTAGMNLLKEFVWDPGKR